MLNHGVVTMGGKKMSKSRGNIVEASSALDRYGADALRLYMLFFGPPEQAIDWPEEGVTAIGRVTFPWLQRVWRLCEQVRNDPDPAPGDAASAEASADVSSSEDDPSTVELRRHIHRTIKIVTQDYEQFSFNTAIARLMELLNHAYHYRAERGPGPALHELIEALLKMLAPMAPYLAEEQWHRLGHETSIHKEMWPEFDPALAADQEVTMVIQVNGKVRDTVAVPPDIAEADMRQLALASEKVQPYLNGGEPTKIIIKPPRLISLVV
jgi:leucyl-tRNA synthetase